MTENAKKWLELLSQNKELQKKLLEVKDKSPDQQKLAVTALAKENGITLTDADMEKPQSEELSDDELDAVAGGGGCGCPVVGGGAGDKILPYKCGCFFGGVGDGPEQDDYKPAFCFCVFAGGGTDNIMP